MYNLYMMKLISTSTARRHISQIIDEVARQETTYAIGRHEKPEALLIPFPSNLRKNVSSITLVNANSSAFDFLAEEPDLYSKDDLL